MKRKLREFYGVLNAQSQHLKAIDTKLFRDELTKGFGQGQFADAVFDGDLPKTDNAHKFIVYFVFNEGTSFATQRGIPADEPEKSVRIEQKLHSM